MRGRIILILLIFCCLLFAERTITMQEAIDTALKNNDELISAGYEVKSTSWAKYSALTGFLPTASFWKKKSCPKAELGTTDKLKMRTITLILTK